MRDRHGQSKATALKKLKLEDCQWPYVLRMVRGIWVVKWEVRGYGRNSWKRYPAYAALGPKGKLVTGIGSRKDTITAAGGRMD